MRKDIIFNVVNANQNSLTTTWIATTELPTTNITHTPTNTHNLHKTKYTQNLTFEN